MEDRPRLESWWIHDLRSEMREVTGATSLNSDGSIKLLSNVRFIIGLSAASGDGGFRGSGLLEKLLRLNNRCCSRGRNSSGVSPKFDALVPTSFDRTEIDDHDAVFPEIQVWPDSILEMLEFHVRQLASEHGILNRISMPAHRPIHFAITFFT